MKPSVLLVVGLLLAAAQAQTAVDQEKALRDMGVTEAESTRAKTKVVSDKKALLVLPPRSAASVPGAILEKVGEVSGTCLVELGRFRIVDRKALGKAMEQQALSASGVIPEEKQTAMGKVVGAQEILVQEVTRYSEELKDLPNAANIAANLVETAAGGRGGRPEVTPQWVIQIAVRIVRKNLDRGEILGEKTAEVSSTDEQKEKAISALDSSLASGITKNLRDLFPLVAYVTSVEGREVYLRFGQDMGLKPGMKFFLYTNAKPKPGENPSADVVVQEVYPAVSRTSLRIRKATPFADMAALERNTADVSLSLALSWMPFRVNFDSLAQIATYAKVGNYFGIGNFVNRSFSISGTVPSGPQLGLTLSSEDVRGAWDFTLAGLTSAFSAYAVKGLVGRRWTLIDADWFFGSLGVQLGGAVLILPYGNFKSGWTAITDDGGLTAEGAPLMVLGSTLGGEAALQAGVNLNFTTRLVGQLGYGYYLPIQRFWMASMNADNKVALVTRFFETSRVDPVDFSGVFGGLSLQWLF